ncbi:MAG: hypothetical protein U0X86_000328 [Wolbachia endosymbiont of Xenopsylla cheopis]
MPLSSPSKVDVTVAGQKLRQTLAHRILKSDLFQLLKLLENEEAWVLSFSSAEYFKQLTANY